MKRKIISLILAGLCSLSILAGCGGKKDDGALIVWAPDADQEFVSDRVAEFIAEKLKDDPNGNYDIRVVPKGEPEAAASLSMDVQASASLFYFPDDQLVSLVQRNLLYALPAGVAEALEDTEIAGFIEAATYKDELYAFPKSADNTYYLYYDKSKAEDGFETIQDMIAEANKDNAKIRFDVTNSWQGSAFFFTAGGTIDADANGNLTTTFNDEAVAKKVIEILDTFFNTDKITNEADDPKMKNGFAVKDTLAAITGTWNYTALKEALGENLGMQPLPAFKFKDGTEVPMVAFGGYKMLGINRYTPSDRLPLALELATFLTSEASQVEMFRMRNYGPTNKDVLDMTEVQNDPLLKVVADQFKNSISQRSAIGGYWDGVGGFLNDYKKVASATTTYNATFQKMLDDMVDIMTGSLI